MLHRLPPYRETPSQTAGPYVHIGCTPNDCGIGGVWPIDLGTVMVGPQTKGERIVVEGTIFDGGSVPLADAVVEVWQADAAGRYSGRGDTRGATDAGFTGFGRRATDADGRYRFETIKPGRVPHPEGQLMAPHATLWIVARGINIGLHTRVYFGDEQAANADDPVLLRIGDPRRRATLIAARRATDGAPTYTFDIRLQGDDETVFFDI